MKKIARIVAICITFICSLPSASICQLSNECSEYFKMSEDKFEGIIILKSKPAKLTNKLGESATFTWRYMINVDKDINESFIIVKFAHWQCPSSNSKLYMLTKDGRRLSFTAHSTNCNGEAIFKIETIGDAFLTSLLKDMASDIAVSGPKTRYIFTDFEPLKKNVRLFGECLIEYYEKAK